MSDRELLELAALAADIEHGADRLDCGLSTTLRNGQHRSLPRWNPLDDDGDALRLACDVGLQVFPIAMTASGAACSACATFVHGRLSEVLTHGSDTRTATRRAIVIASAEIGRRMQHE